MTGNSQNAKAGDHLRVAQLHQLDLECGRLDAEVIAETPREVGPRQGKSSDCPAPGPGVPRPLWLLRKGLSRDRMSPRRWWKRGKRQEGRRAVVTQLCHHPSERGSSSYFKETRSIRMAASYCDCKHGFDEVGG